MSCSVSSERPEPSGLERKKTAFGWLELPLCNKKGPQFVKLDLNYHYMVWICPTMLDQQCYAWITVPASVNMRYAMPSLAITVVLSTSMSRLHLRLTQSRRSTSSCSSASKVSNRMMSSAQRRFMTIRPPTCSLPWNPSRVSLNTISAKMLNK